jgi:hypothetical protein
VSTTLPAQSKIDRLPRQAVEHAGRGIG